MKRKITCLALAVSMILLGMTTILSGCDNGSDNGSDKEVTLTWAISYTRQKDYNLVMTEVNRMLGELLPNTKIEMLADTSMDKKWSLWMAGKTQIDIAHAGYYNSLAGEISKNSYIKLNDLIDQYAPTIKKEWADYEPLYMTGMTNGDLYAIPNIQAYINDTYYISVPPRLKEYLDIPRLQKAAADNPTMTEEFYLVLDEYFNKIFSKPGLVTEGLIPIARLYKPFLSRGFETLGGNESNIVYRVFSKTGKVEAEDLYKTEEFALFMKYARRWFEKGYISKDVLARKGLEVGAEESVINASVTNFLAEDHDRDGIIDSELLKRICIAITPDNQKYNGTIVTGSQLTYCSIPITAKNPERAMQLLELLRTKEGQPLLNTLVYGLEGKHYEKLSDTEIKAFDYEGQGNSNSNYGLLNWVIGTHFNMYMIYPYNEQTRTAAKIYYNELMPNFYKTPVYGLTLNLSNVENELAQIKGVCDQYQLQLISGAFADYQTSHKNMQAKLKASGQDKVITEFQKQIDDFINNKK